ncbi:MAG: Ig-like domain-containing protein, partial [Candidatus Aenigmatarchaeota archaeon]
GGTCGNTPSTSACPTPSQTCADANTRRTYSPTCSAGSCGSTPTDTDCPYGCTGTGVCGANPCVPNPCNSASENTCSGNTLNTYSSPGACTPSRAVPVCSYAPTPQPCQYGCLSLPGPDQCAANSPPTLTSVSVAGTFGSYAKNGQSVTINSVGSDPNSEQVKLKCGSASGNYNLCTGSLAASNPTCSFTNSWTDSSDHTIYCALEDIAGATSTERTTTLSADNTVPSVTLTRNPPTAQVATGTSMILTADASDARSGVATITITVDGSTAKSCSSTTCSHTFTPSYGTHTYSANAIDRVGNSGSSSQISFIVNDAPTVQPIDSLPRGNCKQGATITLQCTASDSNQAASSLTARAWAGTCTAGNCFATRSWTYLNNQPMTAPSSGGTFTIPITIGASVPDGTGIAATCQATDAMSATSNWGDGYPLCYVNTCPNTPVITFDSITPNPSGAGSMTVSFSADRALRGDPVVKIKPGSQAGGIVTRTGTLTQKQGNRYTFDVPVNDNDINGIADVWVDAEYTAPNGDCPVSSGIQQVTIDTAAPTTNILCNNAPCSSSTVYTAPMSLTFGCTDATACASTVFGLDSAPNENYVGARQISAGGAHVINYRSTDSAGNAENMKSQNIRIFTPPCKVPSQAPSCSPSGFANVEIFAKLNFDNPNVLRGNDAKANLYCFIRRQDTKELIRPCDMDPTRLSIIVDKGTASQKDYFNPIPVGTPLLTSSGSTFTTNSGYTAPIRNNFVSSTYQKEGSTYNVPTTDGTYSVTKRWEFGLDTDIFRSAVCITVWDLNSGLSTEVCGDYTVTESEFLFGADFPDLGVTVPLTVDPGHVPVANFTKTMLINFTAVPSIRTASGVSVCEPPSCRVDFSFDAATYDKTTKWDAFQKAFVASNVIDIASNNFACDDYKTLYLQATQAGGPTATTSKEFFVNCETKIIVTPVEKRFTLGDHSMNNAFTVTVINPKEAPATKSFEVTASTTSPVFNMGWIDFRCTEDGCTDSGDKITLDIPAQGQKLFVVDVITIGRSGSFPITFVAKDMTNGYTYSTTASILVFAEGLSEFAAWQLIILVIIVIALIVYYELDLGHRKKIKEKAPRKRAKRK